MVRDRYDEIIVGGGVIGLLCARELVNNGRRVLVIDKQIPGREASWAGGGIVSPLYPWNYSDAITDLVNWAQAYYPVLSDRLLGETGIDPEFNPCGLFMLDSPEHDKALVWAKRVGAKLGEINIERLYQQLPRLKRSFHQVLSMPTVGNIRNPRFLKALLASLEQQGNFTLITHEAVKTLILNHQGVGGVVSEKKRYFADKVLIAAGAWSPLIVEPYGIALQVEPVWGEMLVFAPSPDVLPSIVLHGGKYLIPRKDGRIVVGSTTERVGYKKNTTDTGKASLLSAAYEILPQLESVTVEKHWAGLRPGAPAGLPYMGEVPDIPGLFICAGHYRNGLVTAPASARLMADLILQRHPEIDPFPFRLDREKMTEEMY
ncbi:MAG: glycine oxidase ThiO [Pseudomonadales bacterium]|nr:glycine oxidase ThiO [Pseudomonadales bacterium]